VNPELQRYLWLELTPQRLLVTPVLLLALFALVHLLADHDTLRAMAVAAYWVVIAVGVLWGGRLASEAVTAEVIAGTWDQQRLCSLAPWSMTWAKLLGAPVISWYACAPCLVLIALGARPWAAPVDAALDALLLAMIVLFCHAIGLLASLHVAAHGRVASARPGMLLQLLGLACALPMLVVAASAFGGGWAGEVRWFAMPLSLRSFTLGSVAAFTVWAVLGCHRLMRAELQLRNSPWVWIAFVVFCMVYAAGWSWSADQVAALTINARRIDATGVALVSAHGTALALGYLVLLAERKDPVAWRRGLGALRAARPGDALELTPRWACVLPLVAATAIGAWLADSAGWLLCASSLAFFVRDAGLVVMLNLGARRERADTAAVLYLAVLYVLAPALVLAVGGAAAGWLLPAVHGAVLPALLPGVLQAVLIWAAVRARWQRQQAAWA
jgi:hypothetical protein